MLTNLHTHAYMHARLHPHTRSQSCAKGTYKHLSKQAAKCLFLPATGVGLSI